MSDRERLAGYVEIWWQAIDDFTRLLEQLSPEEWSLPTDLPGWDVFACAAHIAHLESILAGSPEETVEFETPPHVTGGMGLYAEQGVVARRSASPDDVITELRAVATSRHTALIADPPTDGQAKAQPMFAGIEWTWERLLRNRPLDVWMHEQDIRRATGRRGGLNTAAARHVADYLTESLGVVVAKRAQAPPGTTVTLAVKGSPTTSVAVDDDGRGHRLPEDHADPTVGLAMDRETFIVLAGGRRPAEPGAVTVTGNEALAATILASMAVTP